MGIVEKRRVEWEFDINLRNRLYKGMIFMRGVLLLFVIKIVEKIREKGFEKERRERSIER